MKGLMYTYLTELAHSDLIAQKALNLLNPYQLSNGIHEVFKGLCSTHVLLS